MPGIRDKFHEKIAGSRDENLMLSNFHHQIRRMARAYPDSISLRYVEIWERLKNRQNNLALFFGGYADI